MPETRLQILVLCPDASAVTEFACACLLATSRALLESGHRVRVLAARAVDRPELDHWRGLGVDVESLEDPGDAAELRERMEAAGPDLVIESLAPHSPEGAEVASRLGIGHVYLAGDALDESVARDDGPAAAVAVRNALRRGFVASRCAVASTGEIAAWVRKLAPPRYPVRAIPLGLGPETFSPPTGEQFSRARRVTGGRDGEFVVGFHGPLATGYDFQTLLAAVAGLRATRPARLMLIGDGPRRNELLRLSLESRIPTTFAGRVEPRDLSAFIGHCDAIALPLTASGHPDAPRSALEAMAAGVALVATDVEAIRRVLGETDCAVRVPAGQSVALARALEHLAAHPDGRRRLAERASRRAREFSWDAVSSRLLEFAFGRPVAQAS